MGHYFVQALPQLGPRMTVHENTWKPVPGVGLKIHVCHRPDANTGTSTKRKNLLQFKTHQSPLSSNILTLHLEIPLTGRVFDLPTSSSATIAEIPGFFKSGRGCFLPFIKYHEFLGFDHTANPAN